MVGGYTGVDGDYFTAGSRPIHNKEFTTQDSDNDELSDGNCAVRYPSAWWFQRCSNINPNIQPPKYDYPNIADHIEMKIHPKNCITG